jgi:glutamate/tyrosine decarboxylase-like PLP-dependent enzyme
LKSHTALHNRYLDAVAARHVGGTATRTQLLDALGGTLPSGPSDPVAVLEQLAAHADPGLVASAGPRYFGFVTGGAVPIGVAADWLAAAWDQNASFFVMSPAVAVIEEIVSGWVLEMLGLPRGAGVGFVTGAHMANFTCLAAARHEVLRRAGWNVEKQGLQRAPRVRVIAGSEVHTSVIGALRYLGLGSEEIEIVPADGQGRMRADTLAATLAHGESPTVVCAQGRQREQRCKRPDRGDCCERARARRVGAR